jgi:hypothetical protein
MMGKWLLCLFVVLIAAAFPHKMLAQNVVVDSAASKNGFVDGTVKLAEEVLDVLTLEKGRTTVTIIPVMGYSPQTGLEFGVMPVVRILPSKLGDERYYRPSVITSTLLFSTTGMFEADLEFDAYFAHKYRISAQTRWLFLPDKFFGVGNQSASAVPFYYNAKRLQFRGAVTRQLGQPWFVGVYADVDYTQNSPDVYNPDGSDVAGYSGGFLNAFGPLVAFDNRNSSTFPSKGNCSRVWAVFSDPAIGSDFDYRQVNFDGRHYFNVGKGVLANQCQIVSSWGDVPFYRLAALGGKKALRGIPHPLKYIDHNMWLVQSEYRRDIWWRLGGAVFVGAGAANHDWHRLSDNIKLTGGAGLRVNILPKEKLNCRFDFGMASGGDHAFYLSLNESF